MICNNCGEENNERFTFCTGCGESLKSPAPDEQTPSPVFPESDASQRLEQVRREQAELLVGQTLDGKYHLNSVIGVSDTGAVYNAARLKIEDEVAIKIFNFEPEDEVNLDAFADNFRRQAQAAVRFKHPNAAAIYDFDITENSLFYVVTELAAGQSLRQIIKHHGALSPQTVSLIAAQVCDALDEAHRQGIVHCGIKSESIIINKTPNGLRVKVSDFGLTNLSGVNVSGIKNTGAAVETMRYMSPEECLNQELDGRSDIYSFGVVLYELLGGAVPFDSLNPTALAVRQVTELPAPLHQINPAVPPPVEAVVRRSLEKQKEARQQTAADLAREFHNAVYGATGDASQTIGFGNLIGNSPPAKSFDSQAVSISPLPADSSDDAIAPPTFASNLSYRERKGNSSRFFLIAGIALAFLVFLGIAATLVWRQMSKDTENQNAPLILDANVNENSPIGITDSGNNRSSKSSNAEEELNRIRANLANAAARKEKSAIERDLKDAAERFPADYRFTYQLAKIETANSKAHHEAFEMLFGAGEKAIKAGKSAALLDDLQKDGSAELKRLTDHKEWTVLENALRKNDAKALAVKEH